MSAPDGPTDRFPPPTDRATVGILTPEAQRRYSWEDTGPAPRPEAPQRDVPPGSAGAAVGPDTAEARTADRAAAPGGSDRSGSDRSGRGPAGHRGERRAAGGPRLVGVVLAAVAVAVCVLAYQWTGSAPRAVPDSVFPVRQALHFAGHDTDIDARTADLVCREMIPRSADRTPERLAACRQEAAAAAALPAQHRRLFQMQPGFAVIAAPFVAAIGENGVAAAAFLIGVACGLLCVSAFRAFGVGDVRALAAEALFLASPGGAAAIHVDGHGAALLGVLAALGGVGMLARVGEGGVVRAGGRFGWPSDRRTAVGLGCVGAGVVWALVARFADGLAFAVCLVVALGLAAVSRDAVRRVRCLAAGLLTVVVVLLWAAIAYLVGLPGVRDALLDGVTDHFRRPAPADPLGVLLTGDRLLVSGWAHGPHTLGLLLLGLCAAAVALVVRFRSDALLWAVPAVAALLVVLARPTAAAAGAHGLLVWLPAALGVALWVDVNGLRRPGDRRGADDADTRAPDTRDAGGGTPDADGRGAAAVAEAGW